MSDIAEQVNALVKELLVLNHSERIPAFRPLTAEEAGLQQSKRLKIRQALVLALALRRA
jgi:hypothetical protein